MKYDMYQHLLNKIDGMTLNELLEFRKNLNDFIKRQYLNDKHN